MRNLLYHHAMGSARHAAHPRTCPWGCTCALALPLPHPHPLGLPLPLPLAPSPAPALVPALLFSMHLHGGVVWARLTPCLLGRLLRPT